MKVFKKFFLVAGLAVILIAAVAAWYSGLPVTLGQAMLHHENRFVNYALSRLVVDRIPPDATQMQKALALLSYVNLVVSPKGECKTWGETWWLINGVGWCDHSSRVFTSLLEPLDIKAYTAYLMDAKGKSPHSVAYFTPGRQTAENTPALAKLASVGDTYYGLLWRTANGKPATPEQICKSKCHPEPVNGLARSELANMAPDRARLLRELFCQQPQIAKWNTPLSNRGFWQRLIFKRIMPLIPDLAARYYLKLALRLIKGRTATLGVVTRKIGPVEYLFYCARVDQLFLDFDAAERTYREIVHAHSATPWAKLADNNLKKLSYLRAYFAALKTKGLPK